MRTDVKCKKQGGMYDWKGKMDSDQDNQVSVLHTDRKERRV